MGSERQGARVGLDFIETSQEHPEEDPRGTLVATITLSVYPRGSLPGAGEQTRFYHVKPEAPCCRLAPPNVNWPWRLFHAQAVAGPTAGS